MMEKDRDRRPSSAAEVAGYLRAVQSGSIAGREFAATGPPSGRVSSGLAVGSEVFRKRHEEAAAAAPAAPSTSVGGAALEPSRDPRGSRRPRRAGGRLRRLLVVSRRAGRRSHRSEPLLLADFRNTTGEAVFDGALKDALEIQLRQSPYLNVVPASQVRSTLQLMERSPNEPLYGSPSRATSASASASRR